ncbi:aldo/keto reductase [Nocardiopsis protaetiae]|uniref:aldo/keto reductase n=1 Tax=Nocardiopsis protaetiae TaxID=3382270 RepID=UPI00387B2085
MTATTPDPTTPRPGGTARLGERTVARIGYGAMQLARLHRDPDTALTLLHRALDLGIDHIDTAQFYGDGLVNDLLRRALDPGDDITLATKIGAAPDLGGPYPMRPAQRPEELRADVHTNLRALGLERIPLVNLRRMDTGARIPLPEDQRVDLDDQLATMTALRDEGLIGAIGLSSIDLDGLRRALPAGIACVQNAYSLVARQDEDLLKLCAAQDIAWVPYFPLGGAFPGLAKVTDEPAVQRAARALDATPAQIGLAWLLHHDHHMLLIPGTATLAHLEANTAAGDIRLDPDTLDALDAVPTRPLGRIG